MKEWVSVAFLPLIFSTKPPALSLIFSVWDWRVLYACVLCIAILEGTFWLCGILCSRLGLKSGLELESLYVCVCVLHSVATWLVTDDFKKDHMPRYCQYIHVQTVSPLHDSLVLPFHLYSKAIILPQMIITLMRYLGKFEVCFIELTVNSRSSTQSVFYTSPSFFPNWIIKSCCQQGQNRDFDCAASMCVISFEHELVLI